MARKQPLTNNSKELTLEEIKKLLDRQTVVILTAVDDKLQKTETRINQKIEKLITTIDIFEKSYRLRG